MREFKSMLETISELGYKVDGARANMPGIT